MAENTFPLEIIEKTYTYQGRRNRPVHSLASIFQIHKVEAT